MLKKRNREEIVPSQSEIIDTYVDQLEKKYKKFKHKKYRPSFTRRLRIVLSLFIVLLVAVAGFLLVYFDLLKLDFLKGFKLFESSSKVVEFSSSTLSEPVVEQQEPQPEARPERPSKLFAVTLTPDVDFSSTATNEELTAIVNEISTNGFTTIFVNLNAKSENPLGGAEVGSAITSLSALAKEKAIAVYGVFNISGLSQNAFGSESYLKDVGAEVEKAVATEGLEGIMLKGFEYAGTEDDFKNYVAKGTLSGFKDYKKNLLTSVVKKLTNRVKTIAPQKLLGLITDGVYATKDVLEIGLDAKCETQLLRDKNADVLLWMNEGFFDIVFIDANTTTKSKDLPFEPLVKWWGENTPPSCDIGFVLSGSSALKGEGDWKNPDQLGRQLQILNEINRYVFCIDNYSALKQNKTGSTELVYKYITGQVAEDYILRELSITSPKKTEFTTYENSVAIIGASDPNFPLLLNGKEVERTKDGYFSLQLDLKVGKNKFTFEHKGTTKTFNITYRYVVIKSYTPNSTLKMDGNTAIMATVLARTGSKVSAILDGKTFKMELTEEQAYSDFAEYKGIITLPEGKEKDVSLGKIKFTGTHNGITENFYSEKITLNKKPVESSSEIPPSSEQSSSSNSSIASAESESTSGTEGEVQSTLQTSSATSGYKPTGNRLVAEVIKYQIETFDGDKTNDLSQPYNSYLPKGTLDYCDERTIYDPSSGNTYRKLNYGKRVYTTSKGVANIRTMKGSLPSTNSLAVKSLETSGRHTVLTLRTDWKAPFSLVLAPQKYLAATGSNRGTITSATFNYIDITFAYASKFDGTLESIVNSPIFSKAQIIKNTSNYTLRLYLKKTGAFYGWTADYNNSGDLVFKFLNPNKATVANNKFGGRLDGLTIVVDAGHGGSDPGAVGNHKVLTEAERSLTLSNMLKQRLESLGAKVIMTRSSDVTLTPDERTLVVRNNNPDLCVSVHRNAANNASARGFSAHYFNPYTKAVADKITNATAAAGTYTKAETKWHVFYMSRISNCPVVLTENGFMSNSADFGNIKDNPWNEKCADAITKGIVNYFLSIG
jgi:N-acetylmuramoyl-L-alanine amidase